MNPSKTTGAGPRSAGSSYKGNSQPGGSKSSPRSGADKGFADEWLDDSGNREQFRRDDAFSSTSRRDESSATAFGDGDDKTAAAALADGIRDAASMTTKVVKEQVSAVAGEVGHELGKTAEEQMGRGAEAMQGFARAIEAAGSELEEQSPQLARLVNDWAGKVRDVSRSVSNRQVSDLVDTANDFARTQPAIFFGAAVAAGFALARFLKSSAKPAATDDFRRSTAFRDSDRFADYRDSDRFASSRSDRFGDSDAYGASDATPGLRR